MVTDNCIKSCKPGSSVCRDFMKGDCRRGKDVCLYHHPKLDVCWDYRTGECTKDGYCRLVHVSEAEEMMFDRCGMLPKHVHNGPFKNNFHGHNFKREFSSEINKCQEDNSGNKVIERSRPLEPVIWTSEQNELQICRHFKKGFCMYGYSSCKFYELREVVCRYFQTSKCARDNCWYLHLTKDEEKAMIDKLLETAEERDQDVDNGNSTMKEAFQQLNGDANKSAKKLEDTKKIIRSLLLSTKYGLTVNELCSEYELIACGELPFRELGYSNPMDFIRSMRDVVRTSYQPGGACLLRGIADETTAHISALVRGQKSTSRNTKLHKPVQLPKKRTAPQQQRRHVSHFIQSKIYDFMQKYPNGIAFEQFDETYFRKYGKRLNPQLQGYTSIRGLLEACTEVVRLQNSSNGTSVSVYPVKTSGAHNRYSMKVVPYMSTTSQFLDDNKFVNSNRAKPKIEVPEELKKEILSVLLKRENGVFAARFPFEYKAMFKKEFSFQSVGFTSVVELMAEIPDIAKVTRPTEKGDFVLTVLETKSTTSSKKKEETVDYTTKSPGRIGDRIDICVSFIVNPTLFYVQLCTGLDDLYDLMDTMTNFYAANYKDFHLPPQSVVEDQACAAIYEEQWYRAVIAEVISDTEVKVYYVDYGNDANVDSSTLCVLKQEYSKLPCQAFKAKMNNVEPSVEDEFSSEAVQHFFDLTCDQELRAVIVENEPFLCLDIYDKDQNNISEIFNEQPENFSEEDEKPAQVHSLDEQCYPDPYSNDISEQPVKLRTHSPSFSYYNNVSSSELVKVVNISDTCRLHLLRYENTPYVLSSEISALFWDTDILRQMLHQRSHHELRSQYLLLREHKPLFDALSNHQIQGTLDGKVKDIESIYELTALPKICSFFEPIHCETKLAVLKEIKFWSQCIFDEQYWGGCSDQKVTEVMLLALQAKYFMKKRLYQLIFIDETTAHAAME